jgi:hypothetical protein
MLKYESRNGIHPLLYGASQRIPSLPVFEDPQGSEFAVSPAMEKKKCLQYAQG